jgi:hypothetical protein
MRVDFYWLVLGILGVWRLTHLLHAEDGPWNVAALLRRRTGTGFWARLLDCFYCLSVWIAAPFAWLLGNGVKMQLLLWPALSAGAVLLERSTVSAEATRVPYWKEEDSNDLLWKEPDGSQRDDAAHG